MVRRVGGRSLGRDGVSDEVRILNCRRLLERHDLTKALFEAVSQHIEDKSALLCDGTIMDATLIATSPPTNNNDRGA